ncbi:MAG: UDP-N-acetylmuramoyl-L-alanyl-D-glutamate--2,6-diaminopimelate ligase [Coriobacteriia bacterium]|nr:UDP-N-acetylmuramoyl-L-alanyl-D-glutamate--2,6-diaminopimelate ligase [Coriobacteriia bacterium]
MTLLQGLGARALSDANPSVSGVAYRSDSVSEGDAFFCVPGLVHDGHDYAAHAVARGAVALVVERELPGVDAPQFLVADARSALALVACTFYEDPSASLSVVGITGTNGKTTTTYLLDSILRAAGLLTGIIGTVETRIAGEQQLSSRTTPESSDLQALLADMRQADVDVVSMEVSSHAIDLGRVEGVRFAVVAFTNLTQDHLDYHHTLDAYFATKRRLFSDFEVGARVVNIDDPYGRVLADDFGDALTVGRSEDAMVRAADEQLDAQGASFTLVMPEWSERVRLPLAGAFNVSNALVAAGCALALGIAPSAIAEGLRHARQAPGRMERIDAGQPFAVVVDYAHTPDALQKAILALKDVTQGRVIVVFGCGGDRDPLKRPIMGAIAGRYASILIVTSDNPRSEDPADIAREIEGGLAGCSAEYEVEPDRRRAIARALALAVGGDAVLIAGKGHEDYQVFADGTVHFDDREVAREELTRLC